MAHWLFKSEPAVYGIANLEKEGVTRWEGVRNYQARNYLRDLVQVGDEVLFYHSNADPPGVAGLARVISAAYPDATALDANSPYHDPRASAVNPRWFAVDVAFVGHFRHYVTLAELKTTVELADMMVCQRGSRLSIQPVTPEHFAVVTRLGQGIWTGPTSPKADA